MRNTAVSNIQIDVERREIFEREVESIGYRSLGAGVDDKCVDGRFYFARIARMGSIVRSTNGTKTSIASVRSAAPNGANSDGFHRAKHEWRGIKS